MKWRRWWLVRTRVDDMGRRGGGAGHTLSAAAASSAFAAPFFIRVSGDCIGDAAAESTMRHGDGGTSFPAAPATAPFPAAPFSGDPPSFLLDMARSRVVSSSTS